MYNTNFKSATYYNSFFKALMCIVCQSYITRMITKKVHEIQIWQMEDATEEIEEKMKQTWFVITLCMLLSIAAGCVLFISYVLPTPLDKDLIWAFRLANVYFPQRKTLLMCLMKPTFFTLIYASMSIPVFAIYYYHGHISLQKHMFRHHLQNINPNPGSANYHQEVHKRLVLCVRGHTRVVK